MDYSTVLERIAEYLASVDSFNEYAVHQITIDQVMKVINEKVDAYKEQGGSNVTALLSHTRRFGKAAPWADPNAWEETWHEENQHPLSILYLKATQP